MHICSHWNKDVLGNARYMYMHLYRAMVKIARKWNSIYSPNFSITPDLALPFASASVPVCGDEDICRIREEVLQAPLVRVVAEVANIETVGWISTVLT